MESSNTLLKANALLQEKKNENTSFSMDLLGQQVLNRQHEQQQVDNPWRISQDTTKVDSRILQLPQSAREALNVAACLESLDETLLASAASQTPQKIKQALELAFECGLLMKKNYETFVFTQPLGAYKSIENQTELHAAIGRNLVRNLTTLLENDYFLALRQFYLGQEALSEKDERNIVAALCLRAGKKAVSDADFGMASAYLDFGIQLTDWEDDYDLCLALYSGSAEVEYCNSNFIQLDARVAQVLEHGRSFRDTVRVRAARVYSLGSRYQMAQAIDESLDVLQHLGVKIPAQPAKYQVALQLLRTQRLLRNKSNERILRMPFMTDPDKLAAVQMLNLMYAYAHRIRPQLTVYTTLKLLQLTMTHGLSKVSAVGFSNYAVILCSLWRKDDADRYAQLALSLLDKFQAKEWLPRVYAGVYGHVSSYSGSLRDSIPHLKHATRVGLETGDIEFATVTSSVCCAFMIFSGDAIPRLEQELTFCYNAAVAHKQEHALHILSPVLGCIQKLIGKSEGLGIEPHSTAIDTVDDLASDFCHFQRTLLAYVFNDYDCAAKEAQGIKHTTKPPYLHPSMACLLTFRSLAPLAVYHQYRGRARRRILACARRAIKQLERFCLYTPENCLAKTHFLQAELAAATKTDGLARCKYMDAIAVATEVDDFMIRAIAYERAAQFLRRCGDEDAAKRYFRKAHSAYKDWGATAKVEKMEKEMPELTPNVLPT